MTQFTNTIKDVGRNYKHYDKWEQGQANKLAQKEYLVKELGLKQDELELTQKRAQAVVRATEIMDTRSENNCENVEQVVGILATVPAIGLAFAQLPATKALEKHLTKKDQKLLNALMEDAKLAQTKLSKEELQKQIKGLKDKIAKNKTKASNIGVYGTMGLMFATAIAMILWGNSQQKQASRIGRFQAKKDELKDVENFVVYTPEQLAEAEAIAKTLPNKKDRNNLSQAIHELKEMSRDKSAYKKWVKQKDPNELAKLKEVSLSPEQLIQANKDKELITNTVTEINIKAEEFSENLENAFDTFGTLSWLAALPLGIGINKLLKLTKASPKVNSAVSILVPTMTALGIQLTGTMEQKEASRIGRYQARKDLLNNPSKLMSFTDEEMAQASHIIAPIQKKGLFKKIGESFKFLKNYYKQKKEFKIYKEKVQKHNEKLQEAFKQIEITESQKAEAKNLQANVFRAFDEVDEMSQRYSEDIEATTEIAKTTFSNLFQLSYMLGIGLLSVGILKGKISLIKPTKWLNNMAFDKNSTIRNSLNKTLEALQKQNKATRQEFQKALLGGDKKLKPFLENPKHAEIKSAAEEFVTELKKVGQEGVEKLALSPESGNATSIFKVLFEKHFKQTPIAKWARGLTTDIAKLWSKGKLKDAGVTLPKEVQEQLGLKYNYKNYKTFNNTIAVAGIPILGTLFAVPYMFNAWLTDIQKKAGKIGVMKAMERIDDPRIFASRTENLS